MPSPRQDRNVIRLLRQQAALAAFGSYAFREPVLLNILTEAARVCADGLEVPFCKVCRHRPTENDLLIEAGFGWHAGVVGLVVSQANETSPQGRAYVTGLPVIIQNLQQANDVMLPPFYGEHGIISTVDVIIRGLDGAPYGVLEIDSSTQQTYDQHDIDFLSGFANVLAEAVATAQRNEILRMTMENMAALVIEKDRLLADRAVMAQELQHRVRNNLQLVHGMLTDHLKHALGSDERASVAAIVRRVTTLSEVYEQLLGSGMGRTVDLGDYLKSLCASLPTLQIAATAGITLTCVADVALPVDLDTVTALGMAVAELVSNCYGHAFPDGHGTITVSLKRSEPSGDVLVTVEDDGAGFEEKQGSKRHGIGLVRRLLEQVRGTAELRAGGGTAWALRFPQGVPVVVAA
jgi:two-component sensor histidine kinase